MLVEALAAVRETRWQEPEEDDVLRGLFFCPWRYRENAARSNPKKEVAYEVKGNVQLPATTSMTFATNNHKGGER